jgi:glycosyltransferase 2 family protein
VTAKKALWRIAQVALVILITWGIVRALAPELTKVALADFRALDPSFTKLGLATVVLIAFYLLHAWLWRGITVQLGERSLDFRSAIHIYFVSGLGRYIPGRLWQVAGMALLAQRAGSSAIAATAASLFAQFSFITTGLIYLAIVLPGWGGAAPMLAAMAAFGMMAAAYSTRHLVARRIARLQPAVDMLDRLSAAQAFKWWLAYGVSWIVLGLAFVLFTGAFVTLDVAAQRHVAGSIAAAYLGGLLVFVSVAGLGIREAFLGSLLVMPVAGGGPLMSAPVALMISVASRVWFTAGELIPIVFGKPGISENARPGHHSDV